MLKAVIRNRAIVPLEPLPAEWRDGQEVNVALQVEESMSPEQIRHSFEVMDQFASEYEFEDSKRLDAAIEEMDRIEKDRIRREWNLTP